MNNIIDYILDRITMYRLVLYILIGLLSIASILGFLHSIPYSPVTIIASTLCIIIVSWLTNTIMAHLFEAPTNVESVYITALILGLIVSPASSFADIPFLICISILANASKYMLAIKKKHLFNPAAIAVVLTGFVTVESASWWVGTTWMLPFVLIGSYLIIRKLHFEDMVWSYLSVAIITSLAFTVLQGGNVLTTLNQLIFSSSLFFLGGIMLTEPITMPPTKKLQMIFGALVGFLSIPFVHIGSVSFTPELALIIGNIFAYIVSSKQKLVLRLQEKIQISPDIIDFIFTPKEKLAYLPGQYMEWTVPHTHPDSRGNRRYFTLASSPTETNIRLGVKFYPRSSTYKKALWNLHQTTSIVGAQLAGDFTLPKDKNKKLVFFAGGIGITPFRSMIKYLIDKKEKRDITLFYSNKIAAEIVYADIFQQAYADLGIKTVYTLTKTDALPANWSGRVGRFTEQTVREEVPDYNERIFYLSGPFVMITAFEKVLKNMEVKQEQIKKDFFPGLV